MKNLLGKRVLLSFDDDEGCMDCIQDVEELTIIEVSHSGKFTKFIGRGELTQWLRTEDFQVVEILPDIN